MAKITFDCNDILVDGKKVGRMDGSSEVHVLLNNAEGKETYIARFKYRKAKASAKHWLKFILDKFTSAEIVKILTETRKTPLGLAEEYGYVSLNVLEMKKIQAKRDADSKRVVIIMHPPV